MKYAVLIFSVLFPAFPADAVADSVPDKKSSDRKPDYVYVKAPAGELGFKRVSGKVTDVTRDYVLFTDEGTKQPRLYTKEEVKRIELSQDNKKFENTVERHWGEQRRLQLGQRDQWEWISDLLTELLPSFVLAGVLILFSLYIVTVTALQAYERFVLEGNIKRLNTAKLTEEIEKLRIEVIELRKRIGLPVVEEKRPPLGSLAADLTSTGREKGVLDRPGVEILGARTPEFHLGKFIKHQILRLRTPKEVEKRKQELLNKWRREKMRKSGWSKVTYLARSTAENVAIVLGWIVAASWVGAVFLSLAEPTTKADVGVGPLIVLIVFSIALTIALLRLMQDHRIRTESYEEAFFDKVSESQG